jgi:uncharacterized damage-inducible protein DinB
MSIAASLLPEFDHEMNTTRALLERVPVEAAAWKPHPRSFSLGELAMHIATLPTLGQSVMEEEELDLNPPGGPEYSLAAFESSAGLLETFDTAVRAVRAAIEVASDEELMEVWTMKSAGETILSRPRVAVLRVVMMNHIIHHRGQLSVYLRLQNVPLPSIYGPTADTELEEVTVG